MRARIFLGLIASLSLAVPAFGQKPVSTGPTWTIIDEPQSSLVYATDGTLIGEIGTQIRTSVPLSSLPKYVSDAFVAVEDHRFYEHNGVDVVGMISAIKDRVLSGHTRGASTITQQLVGNMHSDSIDRSDRSIDRKLREQSAAREMERHYTKAQILEAYLNEIYFGHSWYGIDAAARHYFGTPAGRLTLAQAATLAAMPKGPNEYDPIRYPLRARQRRDLVLSLMQDQGLITASAAATAKHEPIATVPVDEANPAPYFIDAVHQAADRAGIPLTGGLGGFRVYSTLDIDLQRAAMAALRDGATAIEAQPHYHHPTLAAHLTSGSLPPRATKPPPLLSSTTSYLQGLVVALDPSTGEIRALIGGRDYHDSPFDRALNGLRQPGSAFKPIVYAAAIADSIPPNAREADTALAIPLDNGDVYRPDNADGQFLGLLTMRQALTLSRNPVSVQLAQQVGMDSVIALAQRMGITTPIAPYPSSAIGASAVRPVELVNAYSAFATLGTVSEPTVITRVDDRTGRTVWRQDTLTIIHREALDSNVAFIVRDMMRDVVDRGTAAAVRKTLPLNVLAAGKTGTTNDNTDVWFVGMTPDFVAGVWLGFDVPQPITKTAVGGTYAAPIWAKMMSRYYAAHPPSDATWNPPVTLMSEELDRTTGALADSTTPPGQRYTEYFLRPPLQPVPPPPPSPSSATPPT